MISAINMKELKRKVSSAHFADGLWDILLGMFIMLIPFSLDLFFAPLLLALICYTVGYLGISRIRRVTTYPRTGYVKNPENRKALVILGILVVDIVVNIFIALLQSFVSSPHFLTIMSVVISIRLAALIAFVAYRFNVRRWYLYALCMILWIFMGTEIKPPLSPYQAYRWDTHYQWFIMGGVILIVGIAMLIRFLRNNPEIVLEESNEQA